MSTDKTLADAQPGGRVRLGDQEEPSFNWKEGVHDETSLRRAGAAWENLMYEDSAGEYTPAQHDQIGRMLVNVEQMMEGHPFTINEDGQYVAKEASLSAQPSPCETLPPDMRLGSADYLDYLDSKPSPGGQDALASLPLYRLADDANGNRGLYRDDTGSWVKVQDVERALAARQPVGDQHPDDLAVDAFAAAMKAKMAGGRAKGRGGWNDPEQCTAEDLSRMLRDHVDKGDPRDVANFCMMLHQRGEAIVARQPVGEPVAYSFKERVYRTALGHVWTDRLEGALPDSELREVKDVVPLYAAPPGGTE